MELLDVSDLAKLLGITEQSLYARRSRDPESLPKAVRIGRKLVWRSETVNQWLIDLEKSQNTPKRKATA